MYSNIDLAKPPTDEKEKLIILTRAKPFDQFDVSGKYIDGEWHFRHENDTFVPMSKMDMDGYEITAWIHIREKDHEGE